jgi:hypothetical protein
LALPLLLAAAAGAGVAAPDVTRSDMRPWFLLQAAGSDLVGHPFQGEVVLYRGGVVLLEYTAETGNGRTIRRGLASPTAIRELREALAEARFGRARGNCGEPAPDYVERYGLITYEAAGPRTRSFGGNVQSCAVELREGFDAICTYIWNTVGPSPEVCSPSRL